MARLARSRRGTWAAILVLLAYAPSVDSQEENSMSYYDAADDAPCDNDKAAAAGDVALLQRQTVRVRKKGVGAREELPDLNKKVNYEKEFVGWAAKLPADGYFNFRDALAEFIAMTLFVFFGCGSAMSIAKTKDSAWVLQVALTFGLAITTLAYAIGHYSGGHINCAVTFGLMLVGKVSIVQAIANLLAQMLGSLLGASALLAMYGGQRDKTGALATNTFGEDWSVRSVLAAEAAGTFLLVYVVLETAVNPANGANAKLAPLAIGLAVFLAHSVLIPVDGCSINPTRSFGPALIHALDPVGSGKPLGQLWVFWLGPLVGAAAAAAVYSGMHAGWPTLTLH